MHIYGHILKKDHTCFLLFIYNETIYMLVSIVIQHCHRDRLFTIGNISRLKAKSEIIYHDNYTGSGIYFPETMLSTLGHGFEF